MKLCQLVLLLCTFLVSAVAENCLAQQPWCHGSRALQIIQEAGGTSTRPIDAGIGGV